ncbi:MAG: NmrA family NAD(P)-binding protein [Spirochaetales bacterium]
MRVLVTGATGTVGAAVVAELAKYDCERIPAVRDPRRVAMPNAHSFDFTEPDSYTSLLSGIDSLFLVRPPAIGDVDRYIAPVIRTAARQGVGRIVFLSIQGVESMPWVPHAKIEARIREEGIPSVFLRAGFFMQNLVGAHLAEIRDERRIVLPAGRSRTAFVDTRDIAAVAAHELTADPAGSPETGERALTLTGTESLTYREVSVVLSEATGETIRYKSPNLLSFILRRRRRGDSWKQAAVMAMLYTITRFGNAAGVTNDISRVLGRPPRKLAEFAADYRDYWIPTRPE